MSIGICFRGTVSIHTMYNINIDTLCGLYTFKYT